MKLFGRKQTEEIRMADTSTITEYVTGVTNVTLTSENIMQIPSVKNAIDMISGTVGSLPIYLYKEAEGKIEKIKNDNREFLLNGEPNAFDTSNKFKKDLVKDILLYGKGYSYLQKKGIKIDGLHYVKTNYVQYTDVVNKQGLLIDKKYNFTLNNISKQESFVNMLEVNYNEGVLNEGRAILETLLYQNNYNAFIFKNAILPSGILETEGRLTEDGARSLRKQLERMYSGVSNFFRPLVLEQGLKFKSITQKPNDLMLDKAQAQAISEVEKIFNLPSGILMMKNNIATNVSQENLVYLQRTINPLLIALEEALNKSLLLESEKKQGYFFRFDVSELMKSTLAEMVELVTKGLAGGLYSINQAKYIMDLPAIEGGDKMFMNLATVLMDEKGNIEVPNKAEENGGTGNGIVADKEAEVIDKEVPDIEAPIE